MLDHLANSIAFARRQCGDVLGCWMLPLATAWAGPVLSRRVIERASTRGWSHRLPDDQAARAIERAFPERREEILGEWRRTVLTEAADAWALMSGRTPPLEVIGCWPQGPFLPLGLHFGSGLLALWHLKQCGRTPRFVYRGVAAGNIPGRPVMRGYYAARARLVRRLCNGRPIQIGRAWQKIAHALTDNDGLPILLADTPAEPGPNRFETRIGKCRLPLRAGGLGAAVQAGVPAVPFHVEITSGNRARRLVINAPVDPGDQAAIYNYVQRTLNERPGQWLLWHAVEGYLLQPEANHCGG